METFEAFLRRLEELFAKIEEFDDPEREEVLELLDGIDTLHRAGLRRIGEVLDPKTLERLRAADPAVAWLFDAYQVGEEEPETSPGPVPVQITRKRSR